MRAKRLSAFLLCALILPATPAAELNWSGYGNAHYMKMKGGPELAEMDLSDSQIQLREFTLFLDVVISDTLTISSEIEMARNGSVVSLNYGYALWQPRDWLNVRIGKFLVPFLKYNEEKPSFRQSLMSSPFTATVLAPVINPNAQIAQGIGWSDYGVSIEGIWAGETGVLSGTLAVITGLANSDPAALDSNTVNFADGTPPGAIRPRDGLIQNEAGTRDNNDDKAIVARVLYQLYSIPLGFGLSRYQGSWDPNGMLDITMTGVNAELRYPRLEIKMEWGTADIEQSPGALPDGALPVTPNVSTTSYTMEAWFVEAGWKFKQYREDLWVKLIGRRDEADTNDQAAFTPFDRTRSTLGIEWQYEKNSRLRYEHQWTRIRDFGRAPSAVADSLTDSPSMHMASLIFWF